MEGQREGISRVSITQGEARFTNRGVSNISATVKDIIFDKKNNLMQVDGPPP